MKEKISEKINEIIDHIISKDVEDITYAEYKILECREKDIQYQESQEKRSKEMAELMLKTFNSGVSAFPSSSLPEVSIENTKEE